VFLREDNIRSPLMSPYSFFFLLNLFILTALLFFLPTLSLAQQNTLGLLESVRASLANQPDIEFGRLDVEFAERQYMEASGRFDTTLYAGVEHGATRWPLPESNIYADHELQTNTAYHLGLKRQLRNGLVLSPEIRTSRSELDRDTGPPPDQLPPPQSRSGVYLVATLPLLQGFGREAAAGMETAARQEMEVSRVELQHAISRVVQDTSLAYWKYLLDYMYLEQRRKAEQRAEEMLEQTQALVEADELPAAELDDSRANLSDKKTARISAEQSILESRLDLGMAMGVPFADLRDLPPPADDFGVVEVRQEILSGLEYMSLVEHALARRYDLKASRGREASASTRQKVLEDQMRSRLDLGMRAGYEGLDEGDSYRPMPDSTGSNVRGMSWQISLTYEFPVENREARGQMGQQRVEKRRQALHSRELARDIQGRVHTIFSVLRQNLMELENARGTVELYQNAVKNQEMKYRMGMGTQLDLINTQDNLTQARMRLIDAHYSYVTALTMLRFQTASLVSFVQDQALVGLENLTSLPRLDSKKQNQESIMEDLDAISDQK